VVLEILLSTLLLLVVVEEVALLAEVEVLVVLELLLDFLFHLDLIPLLLVLVEMEHSQIQFKDLQDLLLFFLASLPLVEVVQAPVLQLRLFMLDCPEVLVVQQ
jgi:hypothetical protein